MIKMSDVAKQAKVSTATVSRVLRNPDAVKKETREKVLHVIEQLNYQPNVLARHLRTNKTNTILVVLPNLTNTVFSQVFGGIEKVANENDYRVLLRNFNDKEDNHNGYFDNLLQKQVDGMILLTARLGEQQLVEMAKKYPLVLTSEFIEGSKIPTVSIDNISSARAATKHLIKLGHKRIAHISGPLEGLLGRHRLQGYEQAIRQHNLEYDSALIQVGDFSFQSGYNLMLKLMALERPPTAVFAANDEMAMGVIRATKEQGMRVPHDLAVVGFDNIYFSSIFDPALTTISQPLFEMGEKSMELLLAQIRQEYIKKKQHVLDTKLIIRDSCGGA
jgi:LacI family transcriptional regulator, repressor for deo operon, udp, cdd, tsx, nupC, and nupG